MNKVLFFARDPAGANVIIPLIELVGNNALYEIVTYGKEFAIDRIKNEGIDVTDICDEIETVDEDNLTIFLEKIKPNIIITGTSVNDFTERYLWKVANKLGIYSCCIIDQWINLGIRFSEYDYSEEDEYKKKHTHIYLPNTIYVIDEIARKMIVNDGIRESLVESLGSPHFDRIRQKFNMSKERVKIEQINGEKTIVFASEPMSIDYGDYWGLTEKTIFDMLYGEVLKITKQRGIVAKIIVRPHPREDLDNWKSTVENYNSDQVKLMIDKETDSFDLIARSNLVCGMSSMFLIEAAMCNVPIVSIMCGLRQDNPFIFDKTGVCKSVKTEKELLRRLDALLCGDYKSLNICFNNGATERIWNNIIERIEK